MMKQAFNCLLRRKKKKKLLLIGKVPPPVGGVTIHVERLLDRLRSVDAAFVFIKLSTRNMSQILQRTIDCTAIHVHASNPLVRLVIVAIAKLAGTTSIVTYHGNLGRFSFWGNLMDYSSVILTDVPVVLNDESHSKAVRLNKDSVVISAFITPTHWTLDRKIGVLASRLRAQCDFLYCTNAYSYALDANGRELYGILDLVKIFSTRKEWGLLFSDPSGSYARHLADAGVVVPKNICLIEGAHDFMSVIYFSDCLIRSTTTDGDSISVREAIYLRKLVVASDIVSRPDGVVVYRTGNLRELDLALEKVTRAGLHPPSITDGILELLRLYRSVGIEAKI